jgi:Flp pilus assembly pilin Flp
MNALFTKLFQDEAGFIISAELILIATIAVISLVVGLSEVSHGVNQELEDVGSAVGAMHQSYEYRGLVTRGKATTSGSIFRDGRDLCDSENDLITTRAAEEGDLGGFEYAYGE